MLPEALQSDFFLGVKLTTDFITLTARQSLQTRDVISANKTAFSIGPILPISVN